MNDEFRKKLEDARLKAEEKRRQKKLDYETKHPGRAEFKRKHKKALIITQISLFVIFVVVVICAVSSSSTSSSSPSSSSPSSSQNPTPQSSKPDAAQPAQPVQQEASTASKPAKEKSSNDPMAGVKEACRIWANARKQCATAGDYNQCMEIKNTGTGMNKGSADICNTDGTIGYVGNN